MASIVIRDRYGDCHAARVYGATTPEVIRHTACYLAHNVAIVDAGEHIKVGVCATDDAGLARLRGDVPYADGGVEWLYEINADELSTPRERGE